MRDAAVRCETRASIANCIILQRLLHEAAFACLWPVIASMCARAALRTLRDSDAVLHTEACCNDGALVV